MTRHVAEPIHDPSSQSAAVARSLERIAWLMDRAIGIPGTKIRLGLDALVGLLPFGAISSRSGLFCWVHQPS